MTKTNSLIDRLKAIELPDVDDVAERVDATPETVRQRYDFSAEMKRLENRRTQFEDLQ